jgi:hypothetical protein
MSRAVRRRFVRNHDRDAGPRPRPARDGLVTAAQCGKRFERTDYISGVSGSDDRAVADGSCGVDGVSGAAGCGTAAGCFFWALVAAALRPAARRLRVAAALRPAARCLRVAAAFLAAALCLRVAAAFFPALFRLGLISSSVTIRKGIKPEVTCLCKTCPWATRNAKTTPRRGAGRLHMYSGCAGLAQHFQGFHRIIVSKKGLSSSLPLTGRILKLTRRSIRRKTQDRIACAAGHNSSHK